MEHTQTHLHITRQTLLGAAVAAVAVVVTVLMVTMQQRPTPYHGDIPLPFGQKTSGNLQGSVLYYGKRNNIDVYEISFTPTDRVERMQTDFIYLVHVPMSADVVTTSLDDVISTFNPAGSRDVDYYGYKYSDAVASVERGAVTAPIFRNRFPNKFFASKKARDNDATHQNGLVTFETQNGVTFLKTDGTTGAVGVEPGTLYAFVVNETNGAKIAIRTAVCMNGILESHEVCDDGNTDNADNCRNDCTGPLPIPFGGSSSASSTASVASSTASSVNSSAASSVASSQASSAASSVNSSTASSQASSQGLACGDGTTVPNGADQIAGNTDDEQCDDANVAANDGCTACHIDLGYVCDTNHYPSICSTTGGDSSASSAASSAASSVASSTASSQSAFVYPLSIVVEQAPAAITATTGQAGISLLKFTATAGAQDVLFRGIMFTATQGTLQNAANFALYRTGVATSVATPTMYGGLMSFNVPSGLGAAIPAGTSVEYEVRATAAATAATVPTLQLGIDIGPSNFIQASVGGVALGGYIRIDGGDSMIQGGDLDVTTGSPTLWTVTAAPVLICGDGITQLNGADGIPDNADDEECDDGKHCSLDNTIVCTTNAALCSGIDNACIKLSSPCTTACKRITGPFN